MSNQQILAIERAKASFAVDFSVNQLCGICINDAISYKSLGKFLWSLLPLIFSFSVFALIMIKMNWESLNDFIQSLDPLSKQNLNTQCFTNM